ncbi:hypothetical protein G7Y89_g10453 [Cudoniella acicularis]|uniref:Rhodopsin domain-containing protein n=1 Tax=Cudoniella acicularis TaxID=354080 RepID=A0A8H4W1L7_9HELO|nr:hypothetical protein G7Y89_g10453 [Cudoniella acicularis]
MGRLSDNNWNPTSFYGHLHGCAAATHGWGRLSYYVSPVDKSTALKFLFVMEVLWIIGIALIRISVAISLLRLSVASSAAGFERLWRGALWTIICVQVLAYIGWMVLLLFNCRPLRSTWEPVANVVCWAPKYTINYGSVANSLVIIMDFMLATMPIKLIWTLNRSVREKVLIACLMAMGLAATGIAIYKTYISQHYFVGDFLQTSVRFSLWCKLEELVGIIAACAPSLKSPVGKLLRRIGVVPQQHHRGLTRPSFVISLKYQTPNGSEEAKPAHELKPVDLESGTKSEAGLVNMGHKDWDSVTTEVRTTKSTTGSVDSEGRGRQR